jgi:hypothetical protein
VGIVQVGKQGASVIKGTKINRMTSIATGERRREASGGSEGRKLSAKGTGRNDKKNADRPQKNQDPGVKFGKRKLLTFSDKKKSDFFLWK